MNAVDVVQLDLFLAELAHARVTERDCRAEAAIRRMLERQPDAAYLLVQRVMQLESALCAAGATSVAAARAPREPARNDIAVAGADAQAWWRVAAAPFAGTAFLLRSAEYLLDSRA
jgi:hypothetical protein